MFMYMYMQGKKHYVNCYRHKLRAAVAVNQTWIQHERLQVSSLA